jgi:hypothetical protein
MSYDGKLFYGLLGDFDALPDIEELAADLRAAIGELALAAGVEAGGSDERERPRLGFEMPRGRGGARTRSSAPRS